MRNWMFQNLVWLFGKWIYLIVNLFRDINFFPWLCESEINIIPKLENVGINQKDIVFIQDYFKKVGYINSTKLEKIDVECAGCDHNTP